MGHKAGPCSRALEGMTLGNVGGIRTALVYYYGDHEGIYPTVLNKLLPRYLASIPPAIFPPHHEVTNRVYYVSNLKSNDAGGWGYVNNPSDKDFGTVFPNCTHVNLNSFFNKKEPWFKW